MDSRINFSNIHNLKSRMEMLRWFIEFLTTKNGKHPYAWYSTRCESYVAENAIVLEDYFALTPGEYLRHNAWETGRVITEIKNGELLHILEKDLFRLMGRLGALVASI